MRRTSWNKTLLWKWRPFPTIGTTKSKITNPNVSKWKMNSSSTTRTNSANTEPSWKSHCLKSRRTPPLWSKSSTRSSNWWRDRNTKTLITYSKRPLIWKRRNSTSSCWRGRGKSITTWSRRSNSIRTSTIVWEREYSMDWTNSRFKEKRSTKNCFWSITILKKTLRTIKPCKASC